MRVPAARAIIDTSPIRPPDARPDFFQFALLETAAECAGRRVGDHRLDGAAARCLPRVCGRTEVAVGDLIGFGISHPCTTFDKWQVVYVIDDDYTVVDDVKTFF